MCQTAVLPNCRKLLEKLSFNPPLPRIIGTGVVDLITVQWGLTSAQSSLYRDALALGHGDSSSADGDNSNQTLRRRVNVGSVSPVEKEPSSSMIPRTTIALSESPSFRASQRPCPSHLNAAVSEFKAI